MFFNLLNFSLMKSNSKTFLFAFLFALFCCSFNHVNAQCPNSNLVAICHKGNTICVNMNAVPAHLAHGDFLGPCNVPPPSCSVNLGNDTAFCSNQGSLVLD